MCNFISYWRGRGNLNVLLFTYTMVLEGHSTNMLHQNLTANVDQIYLALAFL